MSYIEVSPESHFPIQNLPYGVFSTPENVSSVKHGKLYHDHRHTRMTCIICTGDGGLMANGD